MFFVRCFIYYFISVIFQCNEEENLKCLYSILYYLFLLQSHYEKQNCLQPMYYSSITFSDRLSRSCLHLYFFPNRIQCNGLQHFSWGSHSCFSKPHLRKNKTKRNVCISVSLNKIFMQLCKLS